MTARLSIVFGGLEDLQNSAKLCREGMPVKIEQLQVSRFRQTDTIMCCEECIGQYLGALPVCVGRVARTGEDRFQFALAGVFPRYRMVGA